MRELFEAFVQGFMTLYVLWKRWARIVLYEYDPIYHFGGESREFMICL